jgi:hypothetical protein
MEGHWIQDSQPACRGMTVAAVRGIVEQANWQ